MLTPINKAKQLTIDQFKKLVWQVKKLTNIGQLTSRYTLQITALPLIERLRTECIPHVLSIFNFAPDAKPNSLQIEKVNEIEFSLVTTKVVSSGQREIRTCSGVPGICKPQKPGSLLILWAKVSIDKTYNKGDIAHPWRTDLFTGNSKPIWPLTITELEIFVYNNFIHGINIDPNPKRR